MLLKVESRILLALSNRYSLCSLQTRSAHRARYPFSRSFTLRKFPQSLPPLLPWQDTLRQGFFRQSSSAFLLEPQAEFSTCVSARSKIISHSLLINTNCLGQTDHQHRPSKSDFVNSCSRQDGENVLFAAIILEIVERIKSCWENYNQEPLRIQ